MTEDVMVAEAVKALNAVAREVDYSVIWWLLADVANTHGSPWSVAFTEVFNVDPKPLIHLPERGVDRSEPQLIEHWFSFCGIHSDDLDRIVSKANWSSPDEVLFSLVVSCSEVSRYRKLDPSEAFTQFLASDDDGIAMEIAMDFHAINCSGSPSLVERFANLVERSGVQSLG